MKRSIVLLAAVLLFGCGDNSEAQKKPEPAASQSAPAAPQATPETAPAPEVEEVAPAEASAEPAEEQAAPKSEAPAARLAPDAGKTLYEAKCKICHDQGLLDAPKKGDKAEWQKRAQKGIDTLHAHSAKGFNKMPAQAVGDVSEAQVHAAVDYLLEQSQ